MRVLPNFDSRIISTASVQSMSARSSRIASPTRMPVTASSPISVSCVAAGIGVSCRAWAIRASMSPGLQMNGGRQRRRPAISPGGGISVRASMPAR
jgi:hypothetical protein